MKNKLFLGKKACALLTAVVLVVSAFSIGLTATAADKTYPENITDFVWDGVTYTKPEGDGTEASPYLIANGENLRWMYERSMGSNKDVETYYKLVADIYLNNVSNTNWKDDPNVWNVSDNSRLNGGIDGDGHVIYGLYINSNHTWTSVGMIGALSDNTYIKNLGMKDSYVSATGAANFVGAFAGRHYALKKASGTVYTLTFENCFVDESVTVHGSTSRTESMTGAFVGAGAGTYGDTTSTYKATFTNCYYRGSAETLTAVSGSKRYPFIAGYGGNAILTKCYFVSDVQPIQSGNIVNVYGTVGYKGFNQQSITELNEEQMTGTAAKTNMPNLEWGTVWQTTDGYPTLSKFEESIEVWDGKTNTQPKGSGTELDPYLISNGAELRWLNWSAANAYYDTKPGYFKLTADIYLNDVSDPNWMNNNPNSLGVYQYSRFMGGIDGDGHTIYGLYINTTAAHPAGLVGSVLNDTYFKNIGIEDSYVSATSSSYVGVFAGKHAQRGSATSGTLTFENCYIDESVTIKGGTSGTPYTGGFIGGGKDSGATSSDWPIKFTNCYYRGNADTLTAASGSKCFAFTGAYNGYVTLENCYFVSNVKPIHTGRIVNVYGTVAYTGVNGQAITVLNEEQMQGNTADNNMPNLAWGTVWQTTLGYPTLIKFGACKHIVGTEIAKVDATYFTTGESKVICRACGKVSSTETIPCDTNAPIKYEYAYDTTTNTFAITCTYSDAFALDYDRTKPDIALNYTIGGKTYSYKNLEMGNIGAKITLGGFNAARLGEISFNLEISWSDEVDEVYTNGAAKFNQATMATVNPKDYIKGEQSTKLNTLLSAIENSTQAKELTATLDDDSSFVSNSFKMNISEGTASVRFIASPDLIYKLTKENGGSTGRTVTLYVDIGGSKHEIEIKKLKTNITVVISGLSFEQMYSTISVKLGFVYENDAIEDFETTEIVYNCKDVVDASVENNDIAAAFKAYINA